ncbi:bacillithiol biosynthesis cysteine-adding enzyme BshC [bacterium]|nr:bacillithiol biosynthesis cysteine-adding enzyme BshC [bacterium]
MGKETQLKSIPFQELESIPALVSDALADRCRIPFGFATKVDADWWRERSRAEAGADHPRDVLVERLLAQNEPLGISDKVRANIEALCEKSTLAVVTGQQVGLGGGPLLTLYKAVTAVAFARHMEQISGVRTVPIFWMATSDHNLFEAAQLHWIDVKNQLVRLAYDSQDNRVPVGQLPLGDVAVDFTAGLDRDMPDSDFKPRIMEAVREAYQPEHTFGYAFQKLGNTLLGDAGLIFLNPDEEELKAACKPFWVRQAEEVDDRLTHLYERSNEIAEAGYHVQAPVHRGRPALFLHEEGVRRKVVLEGRSVRAKSDVVISREELIEFAEQSPERLSAGVTLRPMLQGYMIPTGAYIAGPHEMAYWAQLGGAFEPLGLLPPAVIHRASFTLLEAKVVKKLEKLGEPAESFLKNPEGVTEEIVSRQSRYSVDEAFERIKTHCGDMHDEFRDLLNAAPFGGLDSAVDNAQSRIRRQLDTLESKFNQRLQQHHQDIVNSIERIKVHLRPAGKFQERVISPIYYFNRYSPDLVKGLIDHAMEKPGHHVFIEVEELFA